MPVSLDKVFKVTRPLPNRWVNNPFGMVWNHKLLPESVVEHPNNITTFTGLFLFIWENSLRLLRDQIEQLASILIAQRYFHKPQKRFFCYNCILDIFQIDTVSPNRTKTVRWMWSPESGFLTDNRSKLLSVWRKMNR